MIEGMQSFNFNAALLGFFLAIGLSTLYAFSSDDNAPNPAVSLSEMATEVPANGWSDLGDAIYSPSKGIYQVVYGDLGQGDEFSIVEIVGFDQNLLRRQPAPDVRLHAFCSGARQAHVNTSRRSRAVWARPTAPHGQPLDGPLRHAGHPADVAFLEGSSIDFEAAAEVENGAFFGALEIACREGRIYAHQGIELSRAPKQLGAG